LTVTAELIHPTASADGEAEAETVGGVRSIFNETLIVVEFPALSVAVPLTIWFAPWVLSVIGEVQLAIVELELLQVKLTVAAELFQPFEFGEGEICAVIVGAGGGAGIATDAVVLALPVSLRPSFTVRVTE